MFLFFKTPASGLPDSLLYILREREATHATELYEKFNPENYPTYNIIKIPHPAGQLIQQMIGWTGRDCNLLLVYLTMLIR